MYVVRNKTTKEIVHINPAPLSQKLEGEEVYYKYDEKTMEIGKTDLATLPEDFTIDSQGYIRELSLAEKVKRGLIQIRPDQKVDGEQIVEKTISEKIKEGLITLEPTQKVVLHMGEEVIVDKTPSELIAEGIIELSPYQKIVGEGAQEKIVDKTPEELVADGLLELMPNERIEDGKIVTYSNEEMLTKGYIDLVEYKRRKLEEFTELSFELREEIVPGYKLVNCGLGVYGPEETKKITAVVQAFREVYYDLKEQMEKTEDLQEIQAIFESSVQRVSELKNKMMGYENGKQK